MNIVFFLLVAGAILAAAFGGHASGDDLTKAALKAAEGAVGLALGLVGVMALFMGLMKILEVAGFINVIARAISPALQRLFPEIPENHPAFGAMTMNISANILGLGNAATPFGLKAMEHLNQLNPNQGIASNAQVLFLAINTASVTILPSSVIALRTTLGSEAPASIIAPTLIATLFSTLIAILAAKALAPLFPIKGEVSEPKPLKSTGSLIGLWLILAGIIALIGVMVLFGAIIGPWLIPGLIVGILGLGLLKRIAIYEAFVDGAKEAFPIAIKIIPYLVAILMAVGIFRESGALDQLSRPLGALLAPLGVPVEAIFMALMRSLSGSGSFGYLASSLGDPTIGVDSMTGQILSTIYASSETTFYVLAVYFGAVGIKRMRHALACGLIADFAGLVGAVVACIILFS